MADHSQPPSEGRGAGDSERRLDERREQDRRRLRAAHRRATAAAVAAVAALSLATLGAWREVTLEREVHAAQSREQRSGAVAAEDLERLGRAVAALDERTARTSQALSELAALRTQQADLARAVSTLEERLGAPQRALARAEAAALVVLGQRRLDLDRDVSGAIVLYEAAERAFEPFRNDSLAAARAQLARDLAALRAVPTPDLRATARRLARAEESIGQLPLLGAIRSEYARPGVQPAPQAGLARAWQQFTTSLNQLVAIRRVSEAAVELISLEEADVRRHHMEALLFATRLAALRGDESEYVLGLRAAREWLSRFFDSQDPRVVQLLAELDDLAATSIAPPLPDVSRSVRLLQARGP
jgi:uroporphyrin-3 C-methyltransferase